MIQLITNTVWRDCAQILVTNTSHTATADESNIENITRGPRHLEGAISGTAARRIAYVNKRGTLSANCCVITRADRLTSGYTIRKYATYSSSATTIETSGSAPTCIGLNSDDYVTTFTAATSQQAFSLENASTSAKVVGKLYFGTSIDFSNPLPPEISPAWGVQVVKRRAYSVREQLVMQFENVSRTLAQSLDQSYRLQEEPCFLYDSAGTLLEDKLWHCVLSRV